MRRWHSTVRVRLTLHYAMALLAAGAILVTLLYAYLAHALDGQLAAQTDTLARAHASAGQPSTEVAALAAQLHRSRDHVLEAMMIASLISLAFVAVAAIGFGWWMAGRALRPLHQITATARRVADTNLHERIALHGPDDELKDLADTFDNMLERLDRSFDSQRRFVANASHELRTPLTLNRTLIEVTLEDPATPPVARQLAITLLAINQRHERLIDGLLTLASTEQAISETTVIDMADITRHVIGQTGTPQSVDMRLDLSSAVVSGDPVLLERLVANLVDNAIRYNLPEHGHVTITTTTADGRTVLTINNTGPVIATFAVPSLFEPFRRLPADRQPGSTGLGLSIVRAVTHAHGGDITAAAQPDGGLSVTVRLPATQRRPADSGSRVRPDGA